MDGWRRRAASSGLIILSTSLCPLPASPFKTCYHGARGSLDDEAPGRRYSEKLLVKYLCGKLVRDRLSILYARWLM